MAEEKPRLPSTVKLPPEARRMLTDLGSTNARLKADLETLKSLGLDVTVVVDKLEWAEATRKILLENFQ